MKAKPRFISGSFDGPDAEIFAVIDTHTGKPVSAYYPYHFDTERVRDYMNTAYGLGYEAGMHDCIMERFKVREKE